MRNCWPILVHFGNHASNPNDREASESIKVKSNLGQQCLKQYSVLLFIHFVLDVPAKRPHGADGLGWTADNTG